MAAGVELNDGAQSTLLKCVRRLGWEAHRFVVGPELAPSERAEHEAAAEAVASRLRGLGDVDALLRHYYFEREVLVEWAIAASAPVRLSPVIVLDAAVWRRLRELGAVEG